MPHIFQYFPLARLVPLLACGCALFPFTLSAEETINETVLDTLVITAPAMTKPLEVRFNPKAPQQPLPANDGASFLKTIPGMNVTRKGGTDGDPVFRGMAASRLNILSDGGQILGGCGGRMDPPTAYIFPDAFDRVTLTKGPQTVLYGPGASAGSVRFERAPVYFAEPGWQANGAVTFASFDRRDAFLDAKAGSPFGYVQGIVTHARSGDYTDGDGERVHSRYERHSATAILGWTPALDTRLEFSSVRSDARAAYADRGMDGSLFKRESYGLKFEKSAIGGVLDKVEAQVYYNYIDHVMDNYSLRQNAGMAMASNPDRRTTGGRLALTLDPHERLRWIVGLDWQGNRHTGRSGGRRGAANDYRAQERAENARFAQHGLFSEATWQVAVDERLVAGFRIDGWKAKDNRQSFNLGSGMMPDNRPNPTAGETRRMRLYNGFIRYERDLAIGAAYAGLGHSERAPDFWELINKEAAGQDNATSLSVFNALDMEKTTQIDVGLTWKTGPWQGFVSAFYGKINDYILIQGRYRKPALMMMTSPRLVTVARNIDATVWGGEAGVHYRFSPNWKGMASLAHVHGENDTDGHALGQMPPLEGRLGVDWESGPWSAGALLRLAARQSRYALNEGNIVGQDLGKTAGFGVFSINGGYRWNKTASIAFGVDNLFDKTYAEAISKSGALVQGYEQTLRVNEPGRTFWLKAQFALE
ncbi:MAG: TonB-dependent copper receptor [Zoogloeaceae bacterium]|jgi:iron complex outermembrane receptor protein|nr:TonB-dependent copper receptor [Zoogloeaceae bacterium]